MLLRSASLIVAAALLNAPAFAQEAFEITTEPRVRVDTNMGSFVIELDRIRAPITVEHFLQYVTEGHYSGTIFHRVVGGFIAQAGGYSRDLELKPAGRSVFNESGNGLSNLRGTVGMARSGEPHSGTSQFYINLGDNLDLNPRPTRWGYAVFGTVVEGMDVVDTIGDKPTGPSGEFVRAVPVEPIEIANIVLLTE